MLLNNKNERAVVSDTEVKQLSSDIAKQGAVIARPVCADLFRGGAE
jgi:hypothetical protein